MHRKNLILSPLALLSLAACGGSGGSSGSSNQAAADLINLIGNVVNGPLQNALVFIDRGATADARNGEQDALEPALRTDATGQFEFNNAYLVETLGFTEQQVADFAADITAGNYSIVAQSDNLTMINYGGENASDVQPAGAFTLSAPSGSAMVTPITTIIEELGVTDPAEIKNVAAVLGLPDRVDPLTFNPFASNADESDALQVEKASMQLITTLEALEQAAASSFAGADVAKAGSAAVGALAALVQEKITAATVDGFVNTENLTSVDFVSDPGDAASDLTGLFAKLVTEITDLAEGVPDTAALQNPALVEKIGKSLSNFNTEIAAVTDLSDDGAKDLFATAKLNAATVRTGVADNDVDAFTYSVDGAITPAVKNSTPTDVIAKSAETGAEVELIEIPENEGGQEVLYKLELVDAESNDLTDEEYSVENRALHSIVKITVEVDGEQMDVPDSDGELFEVVKLGDDYYLRLSDGASLDFESADHDGGVYTVWVRGTDDGGILPDGTRTEGKSVVKKLQVQATNVNEAPSLNEVAVTAKEDSTFSYAIDAVDPEGDGVSISVGELPSWLTFSAATGKLSGTPKNADVGEYTISVGMKDVNGLTSKETLTVTVENVNDDPAFETTPTREATQGTLYEAVFEVSDVDNDLSELTISLNEEVSAGWLSFDPVTNTLSGTPSATDVSLDGSASEVSLTVSDGSGGSKLLTFEITVANVNDAPEIADIADGSVVEGSPGLDATTENVTGTISVTDADTGYIDESVSVSLDGATDNVKVGDYGTLTFNPGDNTYVYVPDEAKVGALTDAETATDVFSFTATDSADETGTATFTVNITGANDKPEVTVVSADLFELSDKAAGGRVGTLTATDDFDEASAITYELTDAGDNASFEIVDGTTLKLKDDVVTDRSIKSSYDIEVVAVDSGDLKSDPQSLSVKVSAVNSAPAVTSISASVTTGTLALGDDIVFTAKVSETVNEGSSFVITLSNDATVDMNRSADSKTTFTGTYTIGTGEDVTGDEVLRVISYTSGNVVEEIYSNVPQSLLSSSDIVDIGTVKIDATPPTATLASEGHVYDAASAILTLEGDSFDTLGVDDGGSVKDLLDFSKLTWKVNGQNSITRVLSVNDVSTATVDLTEGAHKIEITFTQAAQDALHSLTGFGGFADTGGTADVLNFRVGFLKDTAGNASSEQSALNTNVAMADQIAPTLSSFAASTEGDATLIGINEVITFDLTFDEDLRADATASIVLSNGGTVQLTTSDVDAKVLTGDYVVSIDDDDVRGDTELSLRSMPTFTVLDISGNVLSNPGVEGVDASSLTGLEIDATPPQASIANTGHTYDVATGVLTIAGANMTTLLDDPGNTDVYDQLDFTKLTWNVNGAGSVKSTLKKDDVASAVVTNATTLTVTLSLDGKANVHDLVGFGGSETTGGTADALDVAVGFLRDPSGNESLGQSNPISASVTMSDADAPTVQTITSSTDVSGTLGPGHEISISVVLSEEVKASSTMTLSLSNGATVSLSSNKNDRTELIGTYTIDADDDDANSDSPLTVLRYTAGTTADVSGNLLEVSDASAVDFITAHVIDTTAPTAALASTGHQYDVATGTLTLAGTNLVSLLSDPADTNVKGVLDFTKLTWNVDAAGSVSMPMSEDDVASAVVTNGTTLTIVLSDQGQRDLHGLVGFGGAEATGGTLDAIDVEVGFLRDSAGNESAGQTSPIAAAEVSLADTTAPTITEITSTSGTIFGIGDIITYTATLSEAMKSGTTMSITLSNDATVTLTADGTTSVQGDYTVGKDDSDSPGLSVTALSINSLVDLSGNAASGDVDVASIDSSAGNKVDTTPARVTFLEFVDTSDDLYVVFNEEVTDESIADLETALRGLEAIADDAVITTDDNITMKIAVSAPDALPSDGQLDIVDFDVTDLAGNTLTIDILVIA